MSWGVDIAIDHGDGYTTIVEVVDGHTYNLTPMWRKAGVIEQRTDELDGRLAREVATIATVGLVDAWKDPDGYRELDPPNGWGDYDDFVEILTRLARLCHQHPTGTLRWNG